MLRFATLLVLCAGWCLGQTPGPKPPGEVDAALRARISQFYQLMVDAKFRQAEALVAEDAKDAYYNGQKPKYLNFEMRDIEYSNDFTHAKATVACETIVAIAGFAGTPLKIPMKTNWKLENGEWYWYVDKQEARQTPFGPMGAGAGTRATGAPPVLPPVLPTNTGFVMGKVKADKGALNLRAGESGEVTLTNGAQGQMSISLTGRIAGVDVKMDRMNLNSGDKAVVSFQSHPGAQSGTLTIQVEQTNEVIPIRINIE